LPPPSSLDGELRVARATTDRSRAADLFAAALEKTFAGCPALRLAFASTSGMEPVLKPPALVDALPEALVACRCGADLAALRAALFWLFAPRDLERGLVEITRRTTDKPAAPTLVLPGNAPWREAAPRLFELVRKSQPVRLVAE
jgi:hypothetical protein